MHLCGPIWISRYLHSDQLPTPKPVYLYHIVEFQLDLGALQGLLLDWPEKYLFCINFQWKQIWQFYTRSTDLYFSELLEIKHLHMKASKMKRYLIKGRTYRIYRNHFNVKLEDTSMNTIGEFHSVKWKMYTIKLGWGRIPKRFVQLHVRAKASYCIWVYLLTHSWKEPYKWCLSIWYLE